MPKNNVDVHIVDIERVFPNPWNQNIQTEFVYERQMRSMEKFGNIDPLTCREREGNTYEIIDGEHRWKAAKELGFKEIPINIIKADKVEAELLTILQNELRGTADTLKMGNIVKRLEQAMGKEDLLKLLPMTEFQLDTLLKEITIDWDSVSANLRQGNKDLNAPDAEGFKSIILSVPIALYEQFHFQLDRFKSALYPEDEKTDVSHIMPFEAMLQHVAQIPDEDLIG